MRYWLLASAALGALGCDESTVERLQGRWHGTDVESIQGRVDAGLVGWALGTSVRFTGQQIFIGTPGNPERGGEYRIERDDDGDLTLSIRGPSGNVDRAHFTLETEQLLRWHVSPEHTVVLRRD